MGTPNTFLTPGTIYPRYTPECTAGIALHDWLKPPPAAMFANELHVYRLSFFGFFVNRSRLHVYDQDFGVA